MKNDAVQKLTKERKVLKEDLQDLHQENKKLRLDSRPLKGSKKDVEELRDMVEYWKNRAQEKKEMISTLTKEQHEWKEKLSRASEKVTRHQRESEKLKAELMREQIKNSDLQSKKKALEHELMSLELQLTSNQRHINEILTEWQDREDYWARTCNMEAIRKVGNMVEKVKALEREIVPTKGHSQRLLHFLHEAREQYAQIKCSRIVKPRNHNSSISHRYNTRSQTRAMEEENTARFERVERVQEEIQERVMEIQQRIEAQMAKLRQLLIGSMKGK
ncbi:coiled-coil domain-containing protein 69-A-like [Durio zibethinus]|uniref:Coiled-coil domain-containing protein 69-A-like n=1 Tax=Durio zibethinus TaxID=66656 RepID=A0A6P5XLL4_DURZI|nr:coiled-coil domain-containing protein 69-A-like [Durio zibethinus]